VLVDALRSDGAVKRVAGYSGCLLAVGDFPVLPVIETATPLPI